MLDLNINCDENKFPFTICWTPIPGFTPFIPVFGHTGVGDADGVTHDFNGIKSKNYEGNISVGELSYSRPYKYVKLGVVTLDMKKEDWNKAIADTDE